MRKDGRDNRKSMVVRQCLGASTSNSVFHAAKLLVDSMKALVRNAWMLGFLSGTCTGHARTMDTLSKPASSDCPSVKKNEMYIRYCACQAADRES